jgi:hypothetical protein
MGLSNEDKEHFSNKPIQGLPLSLLQSSAGTPRILAMMNAHGLNREEKKKLILRHKPEHPSLSEPLSDQDARMLALWADPNQRFWGFWRTANQFANPQARSRAKHLLMAPDFAVLNAFEPDFHRATSLNHGSLAAIPHWSELTAQIKDRLRSEISRPPLSVLGIWFRIEERLAGWGQLDQEEKERLAEAVFAIASATGGTCLLDEATKRCAELQEHLSPLGLQPASSIEPSTPTEQLVSSRPSLTTKRASTLKSPPPTAPAETTTLTPAQVPDLAPPTEVPQAIAQTVSSGWRDEWSRLTGEIVQAAMQAKAEPSIGGAALLVSLAQELAGWGAHIEEPKRRALARLGVFIAESKATLDRLQQSVSGFELLDEGTLNAVEATWTARVEGCDRETAGDIYLEEIDQAHTQSAALFAACEAAFAHVSRLTSMNQAVAEELALATSPSVKRGLLAQRNQQAVELGSAKAEAFAAEDALIASLCPQGDRSCLDLHHHQVESPVKSSGQVLAGDVGAEDKHAHQQAAPVATPQGCDTQSASSMDRGGSHGTEAPTTAGASRRDEMAAPQAQTSDPSSPPTDLERGGESQDDVADASLGSQSDSVAAAKAPDSCGAQEEADDGSARPSPALTPDADYSTHAGERCRPVWIALRRGQPGLAYWMARGIDQSSEPVPVVPPALLAAVALAQRVNLPDGDIAKRLEAHYQDFQSSWFLSKSDVPEPWTQAMNLLLLSCVLRPLLVCPNTGASAVAALLHLNDSSLHQIRQACEEFSEKAQSFRVDAASFKTLQDSAEWQREVDTVGAEAKAWLDRAPSMKMLFQAASQVWQHWLKSDGLLKRLLAPVAEGEARHLGAVKEALASVATSGDFERLVKETDKRAIGRRGEEIHTRALAQMSARAGEAQQLARRWVALQEQRPKRSDLLRRLIGDLRASILPTIDDSLSRLEEPPRHEGFGLVGTAQQQVAHTLRSIKELLDPHTEPPVNETAPDMILGRALAFAPSVDVDLQWQPTGDPTAIEHLLRVDIEQGRDAVSAFRERLATHDLLNAQRILDDMEASGDSSKAIEDLHVELQDEMRTHREMLQRQLDRAKEEVESGLAYGLIAEAERAVHEGALIEIVSQLDAIRNFRPALRQLRAMFDALSERRELKIGEATQRFEKLSGIAVGDEVRTEIRAAIDSGDMLTANEYLQRLESNEPIHAVQKESLDPFSTFFPDLAAQVDQALELMPPPDVVSSVGKGGTIASLDFSALNEQRRKEAADAIGAWYLIKKNLKADRDRLRALLSALGLPAADLVVQGPAGGRQEYLLRTEAIEDRSTCPIPYFGSRAKGSYRVICIWPRPAEEDIVKTIGDTSLSAATILLYFGPLSTRKRKDASRIARAQQRSFLLVDETMLLFLLSREGSPAGALFATALPFAYSQPYEPTSGVVSTEMFFGRLQELQAVQDQHGRCFIYGGRQLGKTALLRKAERDFHSPTNGRFARWIDLRAEGIGSNRGSSDIWVILWRAFIKLGILNSEVLEPTPNVKGRVERFLDVLRGVLEGDSQRRILLLLDEADSFFESDGRNDFIETRRLRELMTSTNLRFKVVFAGLHNVLRTTERANHPLAHLGEPIKVGPLLAAQEWHDAEDLIRGPFAAAGFSFADRTLITRVLAQTNYYPSLIQLYCHHLLRHMLESVKAEIRMDGPRYEIRASDIDAVYRRPNLREEIRSKFQLTLQLDTRYEVIAYSLAYEALLGEASVAEGLGVWALSNKARGWWPLGFEGTTDVAFRILLEEMVGLGVLRRNDAGHYGLRNPNVLLLLGNSDDVADVLLRERELPVEFAPESFRARKTGEDLSSPIRHPLTFQQRRGLTQPRSTVTVVCGSRALGLDHLVEFLRTDKDCEHIEVVDYSDSRKAFQQAFEKTVGNRQAGRTLLVVAPEATWDTESVSFAQKATSRLSSKEKTLHVIFVADAAQTWSVVRASGLRDKIDRLELRQWKDDFVRQWLIDLGLPSERPDRQAIAQQVGYWPALLQELGQARGASLKTKLQYMADRLSSDEHLAAIDSGFGLDVEQPIEVLSEIVRLGLTETYDDLTVLLPFEPELIRDSLTWAALLQLASRDAQDRWHLDSVAAQRLKTSRCEPA